MGDILEQIVADKQQQLELAIAAKPLAQIKQRATDSPPPRDFFKAVTEPKGQLRVIAEVKKTSPSAGVIREDFNPVAIAVAYEQAGAAAISCLTDEKYFQGQLGYIQQIKQAVGLPVLRKDFIIDPYQIYESRAAGADAVLLIAECLDEALLVDLMGLAAQLKLTTLVEVHTAENLQMVGPHIEQAHRGCTLLGINNRNLKTMTTDVNHTLGLLKMVQDLDILVSESGIRTANDIKKLGQAGVHRVLVGEHLMRQPDIAAALRELMHGV